MSELPAVVGVDWLREHLEDDDLFLGDVRGPNAHARGHIPRSRPLVLGSPPPTSDPERLQELAALSARLERQAFLSGREFGLADIAYVPWILRARERMDVALEPFAALAEWVEGLRERPSVAAESELVAAL